MGDQPTPDDTDRCKLAPAEGSNGWTLLDPTGRTLRRFLDTDGDKKLDQWCYYKNGVEVYRDIDSDKNENAKIEIWKRISAEEVSAELVAALRNKDQSQFKALLITTSELKELGLDEEPHKRIGEMVAASLANFNKRVQKMQVRGTSKWTNFSATQPGIVPA